MRAFLATLALLATTGLPAAQQPGSRGEPVVVEKTDVTYHTAGLTALTPVARASLATCAEQEPNEMPDQATPLAVPGGCNGNVNDSDAYAIRVNFSDGESDEIEDLFKITFSQQTHFTLALSFPSPTADLDLYVFSISGNNVTGLADSNQIGSMGEELTADLAPGTYYVGVSAYSGSSSYTLAATTTGGGGGGTGACVTDATTLCLSGGRFKLQGTYLLQDNQGSGPLRFSALTDASGTFTFNDPSDVQAVVKVLNVCGFANRFWVFIGPLTDQEVHLTATDTATGAVKMYDNALKHPFMPVQDTDAFATCTATCTFDVSPLTENVAAGGGARTATVSAGAGCAWTAVANVNWITVTSGTPGSGNGSVSYSVAANSGSARIGTLTVAGKTVTVNQAATSGGGGNYDGSWSGTTSQGKPISFTVASNAFTKFSFSFSGSGGGCTLSEQNTTITYTTPKPITGNTFTITSSGSGNPKTDLTIHGTFNSTSSASGDASFTFRASSPLPTCVVSGNATWTATK